MRLDFKFSNLCGTVYKKGNVIFHGNLLLSPVGNRVSVFDLEQNTSYTLPCENRKDIARMALSPNGALLVTVDEDGRALLIHFQRKMILHHHNFKEPVHDLSFSPNGKYLAVSHAKHIHVWHSPGSTLDFAPFALYREFMGHFDTVTCLSWSFDSRFFVTGSRDMTARVYAVEPVKGFKGALLSGHSDRIINAWFSKDAKHIFTVSKDGSLFQWEMVFDSSIDNENDRDDDEEDNRAKKMKGSKGKSWNVQKWKTISRHYFNQNHAKVVSAAFHAKTGLLSVGFDSGIFGIWELPDFTNIHTLSISHKKINTVAMNSTGEWLAFGCSKLGQLLVWEWQSESYVLKQQGHQHDMTAIAYSPDGQFIATGGGDGKVKLWNTQSGFCFVTFTEHTAGITAIQFAKRGQVVFSASLDGSVRAYDLIRYRNFKTFTSPSPVQFSSVAVDSSGEIIVAGTADQFEIYVWSVQTGRLVDILAGHEGPVSSLAFSPADGTLASASWDRSLRLWDLFQREKTVESMEDGCEILSLVYRPDGQQMATANLRGQICFWNPATGSLVSTIEGQKDIAGGRKSRDDITASRAGTSKSFTSLAYSSDGAFIIAGGSSKYVCIYEINTGTLVKKFQISHNQSLDGMNEFLNSKNMTEGGPLDQIDDRGEASDLEDRLDSTLPGVQKGDPSVRTTRPEARTAALQFSPSGRSWAAATTEGLLIYSLDADLSFDPFELDLDVTEETILSQLRSGSYLAALVMSFRLGEMSLTKKVYHSTPVTNIPFLVRSLPTKYLQRLLKLLVDIMESNDPRIEFHLCWTSALLKDHGRFLKERKVEYHAVLKALTKCLVKNQDDFSKLCLNTLFSLDYLIQQGKLAASQEHNAISEDETPMEVDNVTLDMILA